jgi:hypothetical protein
MNAGYFSFLCASRAKELHKGCVDLTATVPSGIVSGIRRNRWQLESSRLARLVDYLHVLLKPTYCHTELQARRYTQLDLYF